MLTGSVGCDCRFLVRNEMEHITAPSAAELLIRPQICGPQLPQSSGLACQGQSFPYAPGIVADRQAAISGGWICRTRPSSSAHPFVFTHGPQYSEHLVHNLPAHRHSTQD